MLQWLTDIDKAVFFAINGFRADWLDAVMWELSGKFLWTIMLLTIAYLFVKQFGRWSFLLIAVGGLLFAISDQSSTITKNNVRRYRPTHNPTMADKVYMVNGYNGGKYGFFSGHAANSFAVCTFAFFVLRRRLKGAGVILAFAVLTSYSRIYLGVHFPTDIIAGAFMGAVIGFLGYYGVSRIKALQLGQEGI